MAAFYACLQACGAADSAGTSDNVYGFTGEQQFEDFAESDELDSLDELGLSEEGGST